MTPGEVTAITKERLERWALQLATNHATPAVLLGVGHDQVSGSLHICLPEDLPRGYAKWLLITALVTLDAEEA